MSFLMIESWILLFLILCFSVYYFKKYAVLKGFNPLILFILFVFFDFFRKTLVIFSISPMNYLFDFLSYSNNHVGPLLGTNLGGVYSILSSLFLKFRIFDVFDASFFIKILLFVSFLFYIFFIERLFFNLFGSDKYQNYIFTLLFFLFPFVSFFVFQFKFYYIISYLFGIMSLFFFFESYNNHGIRFKFSIFIMFLCQLFAFQSRPELFLFSILFFMISLFNRKHVRIYSMNLIFFSVLFLVFMVNYGFNQIYTGSLIGIFINNFLNSFILICLVLLLFVFGILFKRKVKFFYIPTIVFLIFMIFFSFFSIKFDSLLYNFYFSFFIVLGLSEIFNVLIKRFKFDILFIFGIMLFFIVGSNYFNSSVFRSNFAQTYLEYAESVDYNISTFYLYPFIYYAPVSTNYFFDDLYYNKSYFVYSFYSDSGGGCSNISVNHEFNKIHKILTTSKDLRKYLSDRKYDSDSIDRLIYVRDNLYDDFMNNLNSSEIYSEGWFHICNITS